MFRSLNFDQVFLVPRVVSTIESRDEIDLSVSYGKYKFSLPIIASPMKDVCDGQLANEIDRLGGLGIIHRFNSIEEQVVEFTKTNNASCAIGVNGDYYERFQALYNVGCRLFCVDTANGANKRVGRVIERISASYEDISLIVGNVASAECFSYFISYENVMGIRVGIAGGNSCTTRYATGIFHGMASCIMECAKAKQNFSRKILLIADGGIKTADDFCKALACGADMVMLGSVIAATKDSPAKIIEKDNKRYKVYSGSASHEIQKLYREVPKYIEGTTKHLEYKDESLEIVLNNFCEGLRSSMSYLNAKSLYEYHRNASFVMQ